MIKGKFNRSLLIGRINLGIVHKQHIWVSIILLYTRMEEYVGQYEHKFDCVDA